LRWNGLSIGTGSGWFLFGGLRVDRSTGSVFATDGAYFDDPTESWRIIPAPPVVLATPVSAVWTGSEIVVATGGSQPVAAAFNPASFTWRTIQVPSDISSAWPRGDGNQFQLPHLSFVAGHVVMLVANDAEWATGATVLRLDPVKETWEVGAPLVSDGEVFGAIASSASQLFFLGDGGTSHQSCSRTVHLHLYDPAADTWTTQPLPDGRWQPAIVAWTGNRLLLAGGRDCPHQTVRRAKTFDPTTNTWTPVADMPADLDSASNSVLAAGSVAAMDKSGQPFVYDVALNRWWVGPSAIVNGRAFAGDFPIVTLGADLAVWNPAVTDGPFMRLAIPQS